MTIRSLYLQRHRDQKQRTTDRKKHKTILVSVRSWNKVIEVQALTPALELLPLILLVYLSF